MFYKIILNGMVVDIQTELRYVYWQEANNLILSCPKEMANGILSSDSSVIWHVEGLPEFPEGLCQTAIVEEIEEDEYLRWKERLEAATTETEEPAEESPVENATAEVSASKAYLSIQDMLTIQELMDKVEKLEKENELLSECLLEMSEKVYA